MHELQQVMGMRDGVGVKGRLTAAILTPDPDAVVLEGLRVARSWTRAEDGQWLTVVGRDNAFLTQGLSTIIRRYLGIAGAPAAPTGIAVSSDNAAVLAGTTAFGGTFRYAAFNATFPSSSGATGSGQSSFTKGAAAGQIDFAVRKIGLTNATADTAGAVQDIIGGAGAAPYNEPLTIDLTGTTSFTFTPQIDVTLTAL